MAIVIQVPEVCPECGFSRLGFSAVPVFCTESPMILLLLYRDLWVLGSQCVVNLPC